MQTRTGVRKDARMHFLIGGECQGEADRLIIVGTGIARILLVWVQKIITKLVFSV